ncbi:Ig-like domain-containing protein [Streptosporangium lutulentum]
MAFTWQQITPDMVAEANVDPFVIYGTNDAYGLIAEARVYVRPEMSDDGISIQGAESFEQHVEVGEQPYLPTKVEVSYNDGSRDNQAVGVNWRFDPDTVDTAGTYTVVGDLVLPPYVSEASTIRTTLTLTVGEGGPVWKTNAQARSQCTGGGAYVTLNVRNDDDVPLTIELITPYGSRTVANVAPGKSAYQAFNSRAKSIPAGTATVKVTGTADGVPVTVPAQVPYGALNCG